MYNLKGLLALQGYLIKNLSQCWYNIWNRYKSFMYNVWYKYKIIQRQKEMKEELKKMQNTS